MKDHEGCGISTVKTVTLNHVCFEGLNLSVASRFFFVPTPLILLLLELRRAKNKTELFFLKSVALNASM